MTDYIVVAAIGVLIGWNFPQPFWAKWFIEKLKSVVSNWIKPAE